MPVLFAEKQGQVRKSWTGKKNPLDIRDSVKKFDEDVRSLAEDVKTRLMQLSVQWADSEVGTDWTRKLAAKANDQARQRSAQESEQRLKYLNEQLGNC